MVISLLDMAGLLCLHPRLLQGLGSVRAHRQGGTLQMFRSSRHGRWRLFEDVGSHYLVSGLYGHLLGQGGSGV